MQKIILVAGATGNLGERIIKSLVEKGAIVRAVVRKGTDHSKFAKVKTWGVEVYPVDMSNATELKVACEGVSCIVSALQGLRDVIVDVQTALLQAGIAAGVKRFIPSDFAVDFTPLPAGDNRNFDLRREFHKVLHQSPISATSIYNGAFADILSYNTPMLDFKKKSIGYWGDDPDWKLDFTTMDETAAFTAAAALDESAPQSLRIASFQVSPNDLVKLATALTQTPYRLVHLGSLQDFAEYNRQQRSANPEGEKELYPRWQQGQYMHDQFSTHHERLDNERYPGIKWTSAEVFLTALLSR